MEYNEQSLRLSLGEIRTGIGWLHLKRLDGSKCSHCLQACRSNPHFGHCPTGSVRFCSSAPHSAQRETVRVPGMFIGRGPNVFSFFGADGFSNSFFGPAPESWYPRCRYLRSDKKCLLQNAHSPPLARPAQEVLWYGRKSLMMESRASPPTLDPSTSLRACSRGRP